MKLFNTLSKKIEVFKPIFGKKVNLYTCGPTVYNFAHIGNLRTFVFEDILRRTLEYFDFEVTQVMNITDVDDKTIVASHGDKTKFEAETKKFEREFWRDAELLNIKNPQFIPRATEYVEKMVVFIKDLLDKGFAYKGQDGSVYFKIDKFPDYGKLSNLDRSGLKTGARVNQDEYSKENPADFVLWKAWDEKDGEIFWQTDLGKGRPGWHIECSTMSQDKFKGTIDIHAGGVDLIFPHHENEIAQSEARNGKKFVNYWLHAEHLLVDGKKMSKSLGNFYTLHDLAKKGFGPLDFRFLCLSAHYREKLNFTWESLSAAKTALARARKIVTFIDSSGEINQKYLNKFKLAVENDLNIPEALAVFWQMLRDEKLLVKEKRATALEFDKIFALDLGKSLVQEIPAEVVKLKKEREEARKKKDFELSDKLRQEIESLGYVVEDTAAGSLVRKR